MRSKLDFLKLVQDGIDGKNTGLYNGLDNLNKYLHKTQRGTYYAIGGMPGSGKSAFLDHCFVLAPFIFHKNQGSILNVKWLYYSFEISEANKRAKWISYKIYNDHRVLLDPSIILGKDEKLKLTDSQHKLVQQADIEIEDLMYNYMDFVEDPDNPTGIFHDVMKYMNSVGKIETEKYKDSEGRERDRIIRYIPNDPNHHVIVIVDHAALCKSERDYNTKQNIDKLSEYMRFLRNLYNITAVVVCQFNKGLSSVERQKLAKQNHQDMEPILEDFKDTGNIGQDCNVALGMFNPAKFKVSTYLDYDITQMPDSFRAVNIMKNRDGKEFVSQGLYFQGGLGRVSELPDASMFGSIYDYKNYQ